MNKNYLDEPVLEYIKNNNCLLDSVDVTLHFKLVKPVLDSLYRLMANNKIKVVSVGIRNYYKVI
jgi:hypothetical protein